METLNFTFLKEYKHWFVWPVFTLAIVILANFTGNLRLEKVASREYSYPENITIGNYQDSGFSVSFTTKIPTTALLVYRVGENPVSFALDDRANFTGGNQSFALHHFTLKNLRPEENVVFTIKSGNYYYGLGGEICEKIDDLSCSPLKVTTAPVSETPPLPPQIILGQTNPDSLVYLTEENNETLSTISDSSGRFILDLSLMRSTLDPFSSQFIYTVVGTSGSFSKKTSLASSPSLPVLTIE